MIRVREEKDLKNPFSVTPYLSFNALLAMGRLFKLSTREVALW